MGATRGQRYAILSFHPNPWRCQLQCPLIAVVDIYRSIWASTCSTRVSAPSTALPLALNPAAPWGFAHSCAGWGAVSFSPTQVGPSIQPPFPLYGGNYIRSPSSLLLSHCLSSYQTHSSSSGLLWGLVYQTCLLIYLLCSCFSKGNACPLPCPPGHASICGNLSPFLAQMV